MKIILFIFVTLIVGQIQFLDCKKDCTMDWIDCTTGCDSIGNPQYCHQNCQKIIHSCLDECPKIVCIDECRVQLDSCRKNGTQICEKVYSECEQICEETYQFDKEEL